jgi:hypothetical protein
MKLPVVPRLELELAQSQLDAWRRRAETMLHKGDPEAHVMRPARRKRSLRTAWSVLIAVVMAATVAVGALALPGRTGGAASPDYPGCIGKARYENPIQGNQYQELVNALYACGIYRSASTDG